MAIKIFGLGFRGYGDDKFNLFDGFIVIITIFEDIMQKRMGLGDAIKAVRVFRSIRVLRVTRLLRSLRFMKVIIQVVMASLEQFTYIALLLLLLIVIFSLVGM